MQPLMTPLHRALGRGPSALSHDLIDAAIVLELAESDDLDWKKSVPAGGDDAAREFAKDIAAMANASGGVIVIGVEEERGRGTAKAVNNIDISEPQLQRLRSWAAAHLRPIVAPLGIIPIPSTENAGVGLIAVTIPASTSAPHFVNGKDNILRAPVRYGTQTRWLTEPELAHAYSNRFQTAASLGAQLEQDIVQAMHGLDRMKTTWLVAVARPEVSGGTEPTPLTQPEFGTVIFEAAQHSEEIAGQRAFSPLREHARASHSQRLGLRRRIFEDRTRNDVAAFGETLRVELHDDGTIALCVAASRDVPLDDGPAYVDVLTLEGFVRDLVGLIEARSAQSGYSGRHAVRVEMFAALKFGPGLRAFGPQISPFGSLRDPVVLPGSREVQASIPITTTVQQGGRLERVAAARVIAFDLLHQFSVSQLLTIPED